LKVYPASNSRSVTHQAVGALKEAGHEVTHDWSVGPKRTYSDDDAAMAVVDINGIVHAQVLLLLWQPGLRAANTELGIAIALHRRIILVGCGDIDENIFYRLPVVVRVLNMEAALEVLDVWALQEYNQG